MHSKIARIISRKLHYRRNVTTCNCVGSSDCDNFCTTVTVREYGK